MNKNDKKQLIIRAEEIQKELLKFTNDLLAYGNSKRKKPFQYKDALSTAVTMKLAQFDIRIKEITDNVIKLVEVVKTINNKN